jgi:hypothetical protein
MSLVALIDEGEFVGVFDEFGTEIDCQAVDTTELGLSKFPAGMRVAQAFNRSFDQRPVKTKKMTHYSLENLLAALQLINDENDLWIKRPVIVIAMNEDGNFRAEIYCKGLDDENT